MISKAASFLQSTAWEEFQRKLSHVTYRIDGVLVIERTTPIGRYWYVGRAELDESKLRELVTAANEAKVLFLRIDPTLELRSTNYAHLPARQELRMRPTVPTQPQDSLILDVTPSTDKLLTSFHEKTRYNIRLAERKGVVVEESNDEKGLEAFLNLTQSTADRQAFRYHTSAYYQTMLEVLGRSQLTTGNSQLTTEILVARHDNRPIAAIIVLYDHNAQAAYYLHGASWYERRKFMAPHLLQWTAIQRAKERGCTAYDFWGIAPPQAASEQLVVNSKLSMPTKPGVGEPTHNSQLTTHKYRFDPNHSWAGVTRFKLGFGGEVVHYPDSFDVVLNPTVYTLYTLGRRLRRSLFL